MNHRVISRLLVICPVLAVGTLRAQNPPVNTPPVISLHPVKPDDPANFGFRPLRPGRTNYIRSHDTVFLITNHTGNTVIANLLTLEIKSGSNWTTQTRLSGPLILSAPGGVPMPGSTNGFNPGLTTTELKSHQSAYATIHFSGSPVPPSLAPGAPGLGMNFLAGQPTGAVWRLSVNVQEKVTGLSDASTRLTHYPDTRARLATAGVTNAPLNPFSAGYSYFGKPTKVTSAEVSREGTVDQ